MLRWQASTPILALVPMAISYYCGISDFWISAIVSNVVGSLIFYKIDKKIFNNES